MPDRKEKDNSQDPHLDLATGKKPSMKRRCDGYDYYDRGIYMITLATEGRQPLLGQFAGKADVVEGNERAHVVLTSFGERVKECWQSIPQYHREVECLKLCIMPDHLHGILYVHERMDKHLGKVIEGFKTGTRKAARELGLLPSKIPHQKERTTEKGMQGQEKPSALIAQTTRLGTASPVQYAALPAQQKEEPLQKAQTQPLFSRHSAAGRAHGVLWEPNYNDRLLLKKGQLNRMYAYLDDNPRRLLQKREHPEYFTMLSNINVVGISMQAMGNRFLLDKPTKLQVQCSRRLTAEEIEEKKRNFLTAVKGGGILVSPCISPGEQQIATAALQAGIPLIVLLLNGFPRFFKPQPRYAEACANGKLLMLAPFCHQNEKIENMRQRCLELNDIAAAICKQ